MKIRLNNTKPAGRFVRPVGLVLVLLAGMGVLSGCASLGVKPWERDQMAKRSMRPVTHPIVAGIDAHIEYSKEGSTGGQSASGGGCGCN